MDSAAGSCNACGATCATLIKLSLGKDFFGRMDDRLLPLTDQSPKRHREKPFDAEKSPTRLPKHHHRDRQTRSRADLSTVENPIRYSACRVAPERNCRPARCRAEALTSACERRGPTGTRTTEYHQHSSIGPGRPCLVTNATFSSVRIDGAPTIPVGVAPSSDLRRSTPTLSKKRSDWT